MNHDCWTVADSRTGRRATVTSMSTREQAEQQIEAWRERDRRGKRPDIHHLMPFLVPARCSEVSDD